MTDDLPPLPEPRQIVAAPMTFYSPEDQAFFRFWYGHMIGDLMQPPLANIAHQTARYIWDAAVIAEREQCAKVCESVPDAVFAAIWKSLVIPGEFDAMDETDKNRWRGVIMQAIGFTAELKAAAIRKDAP